MTTNAPRPASIDRKPITIRAACHTCGGSPRLHRCVLVRMVGNNNHVKTTCLTCGNEVTK